MPYNTLDSLPAFVKKRGKKEQEKWMNVWNTTFRDTGSETEAYKRANGSLSLSVRWADLKELGEREKRFPACAFFISSVFPDWDASGVYRVQVMRTGLWREHPEYGDILITKDDLVDAVKNFRNCSRKPFLDDDHGITHPQWSARPGESFGWMRDMWVEDLDGNHIEPAQVSESTQKVLALMAEYEVNEEANGWLQKKAKALYSPTFHAAYYNKETGELQGMTVLGGAMTNVPYFDGMEGFLQVAITPTGKDAAKRFAEMYPKASVVVTKPEGMSTSDAVAALEKFGLEVTSVEFWTLWARLKEAADLASKLAELESAGFSISYFYQGVQQYSERSGKSDGGRGEEAQKTSATGGVESEKNAVAVSEWADTRVRFPE